MLFPDQLNHVIELKRLPQRIVSLVPSQTALLYNLGLDDEVVGITKFCVHPREWFRTKERVGGTKQLDIEKIRQLTPDLILGNKEENVREQIEKLQKEFPVWMSDVNNLQDAYKMIAEVGKMTGKEKKAEHIVSEIQAGFHRLKKKAQAAPVPRIAYFIWRKPYMVAGSGTFIHQMISAAGFENVFSGQKRYPEVSAADLKNAAPDYLFLSSEPFPFKKVHFQELRQMCPQAKSVLVDGEMFSWYGSHLLKSPDYFLKLRDSHF